VDCSRSRRTIILAIALVLLLNAGQYVSAEIPHENFDLIKTNLEMVVQMLNQGINMTEQTMICCIDDRPSDAHKNLVSLDSILDPADELIGQIQDVASSYYNLSYLTPPFENLSMGGHGFVATQISFLSDFQQMKALIGSTLPTDQVPETLESMSEARGTIYTMERYLDIMDSATSSIANLTVSDSKAFNTTNLEKLIDRMRSMLEDYRYMLNNLFFLIQWGRSFVLLILDKDTYPLGEIVKITGFLFNGPNPIVGKPCEIWKDGEQFNTVISDLNGTFNDAWKIPIDAAELGHHNISARAIIEGETFSDTKGLVVVKIPTDLRLYLNGERFSPGETIVASAYLLDYKLRPISGRYVSYLFEGRYIDTITSYSGRAELRMSSSDLDWGKYSLFAFFYGTEIYDPSSNETGHFSINLNTSLSLTLSAHTVRQGDEVTITTSLYAKSQYSNASKPLSGREISIRMDSSMIATGLSDENGGFVYIFNTSRVPAGSHIITALFFSHEPKYEDASSLSQVLVVYVPSSEETDQGEGGWWSHMAGNFLWFLILIIIIIILAILMLSKDTIQKSKTTELRGTPRISAEGTKSKGQKSKELIGAEAEAALLAEAMAAGVLPGVDYSALGPRGAIIKRYGILLIALRIRRKVPIQDHMTAREISGLLRKRGYPEDETAKLTVGFERAMYSGKEITADDWERFSALADTIQNYAGGAR